MRKTEAPSNPRANRKRMTQIMFVTFNWPARNGATQAILALHASGRTMSVVPDSGDGAAHTVTIYEGFALPHAFRRLDFAGRNVTEYLMKIRMERGYPSTATAERDELKLPREAVRHRRGLRHKLKQATENVVKEVTCELPDDNIVIVGSESLRCPEVRFPPSFTGKEANGIQDTTSQSSGSVT